VIGIEVVSAVTGCSEFFRRHALKA
jgi:hypothetical protein